MFRAKCCLRLPFSDNPGVLSGAEYAFGSCAGVAVFAQSDCIFTI